MRSSSKNIVLDFDPKIGYNGFIKTRDQKVIEAPTNCPSCDFVLEWRNDILYCENPECEAKTHKKVEHFAKTMKIKGLGPSTIEKLYISDVREIYEITEEEISELLGSDKLASKLFDEIQQSLHQPLNVLLPAFGIALAGRSAADKLSKVVKNVHEIDEEACQQAGIGPKATQNLIKWLDNNLEKYIDLSFSWEFESTNQKETIGIVCISGKLKSFKTKADAKAVLVEMGYQVKDSITKDVTILVNESGIESAKTLKARDSGVRIVNNLSELIGDIK